MLTKRGCFALTLLALGGVVGGWGGTARAVTLDTLLGGGSFTVGNATYSGFVYGGTTAASTVTVNAITSTPGTSEITFGRTATPWTLSDGNSVVSYHVSFATPVNSIGLDFIAAASGGAVASVGETASNGATSYPLQVVTGIGPSVFSATQNFTAPVSSLNIVKSIDTAGGAGSATITSVDNTYTVTDSGGPPIPEPASLGVLGLGALALIRRRR